MKDVVEGVRRFRRAVFPAHRVLFDRLAHGQSPAVMFVTCSDSRVDPSMITQSPPGSLFVLRNAGNLVPRYGPGAEAATIEYAVDKLEVRHIVVCGHSDCGAMTGLLEGVDAEDHPAIASWLSQAEDVRSSVAHYHSERPFTEQVEAAIRQNVWQQLENLKTHPCVQRGLQSSGLQLHGWVYDIGTGSVFAYDPEVRGFVSVLEAPREAEMLQELDERSGTDDPEEWLDHGPVTLVLARVGLHAWADTREALQSVLGCSAEEAEDRMCSVPVELMRGVTEDEAEIVRAWMHEVGASVELRR